MVNMPQMVLRAGGVLVVWIGLGVALLAVEVAAWACSVQVRLFLGRLQQAYGVGPDPPWILQSDVHLHMLACCVATLWFGIGTRLFNPLALPWLPIGCVVALALTDELLQLGSANRSFGWGDQVADAIGIVAAVPLLLLMRRVEISRVGPEQIRRRS